MRTTQFLKLFTLLICVVAISTGCSETESSPLTIRVEGGEITGKETSTPGTMLYAGIPYAAPPVGELRWKEPQPVIPWEGIRAADAFSKICYQYPMEEGSFYEKEFYPDGLPELSEDCLYLNVWTPAAGNQKKLPVVMWIHGGGLDHGWGHEIEFDGEAFAREEVILVTINYRVGVFGFMAHSWLDGESPHHSSGNYGTLDQIAALQWIRNNIEGFGGDPQNITIMGQSAGARSVMALLTSPLTKGLFKNAIIQSGGGYRRGGTSLPLKEREQVCEAFTQYTGAENLNDLRAISPLQLMELRNSFNAIRRENNESTFNFSPNVDGYVLKDDYDTALEKGTQHLVPAIIGYNSEDGAPEVLKEAAVQWSRIRAEQGEPETYVYCFKRQMPGDEAGAFHSAELWYMFGTMDRCWRPFTQADYELSNDMIRYWTNFIKTGNPNSGGVANWPACSIENNYIKQFDIEN